ncbi:MAG: FAD:protein FMN transferase [Firmicutes bacterium]|nr:FAD:protein FMN transferase [Bacillota bacterium]
MKRILCALLVCILLTGCSQKTRQTEEKIYEATFLSLFDTVTVIKGAAESKEAFSELAGQLQRELLQYHQLFDIYNDYEGVVNLKAINDRAGEVPVAVDRRIIDLLLDCKRYYELTNGKVNVAMGSVLELWHEERNNGLNDPENAKLPKMESLKEASTHTDFDKVIIDEEASTVFFSDPDIRLDVGAVAKGWSVQRVAENAPAGLLISVGGNVCATGPKRDMTPWVVGVQNPSGGDYLHTLYVSSGCVVTSGDYQRCYAVDGKLYHHIIDPETLFPGTFWRSVTIVCDDSGLSDALSTALFLLPMEEGQMLLDACGAKAMWVDADGNQYYSPGFDALIRT